MKNNKTIKVSTRFFELKIFWNGTYVSSQLAILIGLLVVKLFARDNSVSKLCTIILILDLISILFIAMQGASIDAESEENSNNSASNLDVKVEHSNKSNTSKTVNKPNKSNNVIRNKVPVPVKDGSNNSDNAKPKQETIKRSNVRELKDMTEDDWKELFDMGGDC